PGSGATGPQADSSTRLIRESIAASRLPVTARGSQRAILLPPLVADRIVDGPESGPDRPAIGCIVALQILRWSEF
ncbi:MAG: hypothetical protein ACYC5J_00950, partial [Chloroflexota bacterium]